jgi:hypothetical protein
MIIALASGFVALARWLGHEGEMAKELRLVSQQLHEVGLDRARRLAAEQDALMIARTWQRETHKAQAQNADLKAQLEVLKAQLDCGKVRDIPEDNLHQSWLMLDAHPDLRET